MKKFLSQKVRDQVEEVAVDMANGMILIAMTLFRNAKIVIDRFHVRQLINTLI
jgi:transposase